MVEYSNYEELQKHDGNKKYEVLTLIKPDEGIKKVLLDNVTSNVIVQAVFNPIKEENYYAYTIKVDDIGSQIDRFKTSHILKNAGDLSLKSYSNWIDNSDKTNHKYLNPLSDNNYEPKEWLYAFKSEYDRASASYYFNGTYYLKINKKWNAIDKNFDIENFNFDKHFPDKYAIIRMLELEDHTPDFSRSAAQRDTTLWTYHGYEEGDREEGVGLDPINFSSGWHYLQLKMPGSEPLKIKRYGSMGVNMHTYIIPDSLGGREDVAFIVQEPSELYPDREYGGMYVVRPRELGKKLSQK